MFLTTKRTEKCVFRQKVSSLDQIFCPFHFLSVVFQGLPGKSGAPGDAGPQGLPVSVTSDLLHPRLVTNTVRFLLSSSDVDV